MDASEYIKELVLQGYEVKVSAQTSSRENWYSIDVHVLEQGKVIAFCAGFTTTLEEAMARIKKIMER